MSGNKCVYFNCGKSRYNFPGLKMFTFPSSNENKYKKWILHSGKQKVVLVEQFCIVFYNVLGNPTLALLPPEELKTKRICENHFYKHQFNESGRLVKNAVPIAYNENKEESNLKVLIPTKQYKPLYPAPSNNEDISVNTSTSKWLCELTKLPSPSRKSENIKIKRKLLKSQTKLLTSRSQVSKLKKKVKLLKDKFSVQGFLNSIAYSSHHSKILVNMQVMHKNNQPWNKHEKDFSTTLYFKSPAAYKHLRKQQIRLPSVTTIKRWIGHSKFTTGFNKLYFQNIQSKTSTMTDDEKICIICFDEMSIKKELTYSPLLDLIEGFEDLGELGRDDNIAQEALVFLARGLYSNWKLPIAYFVSRYGVKHYNLKQLILRTLEEVRRVGLVPKGIVCDQATNNRSAFQSLTITTDKPYFYSENDKIFAFYDIPHLFKSLRNNMLNADYILEKKRISFEDIRKTYTLDQQATIARSLVKISPSHMYPNAFQKLSVKLAVQVFSRSMSTAMNTAIHTGQLVSDSAVETSNFIYFLNNLFDCLNSRCLYDSNPMKCALSVKSPQIKKTLEEGILVMEKLSKVSKTGVVSRPPCFDGLVLTINSILLLYEQEIFNKKSYLITSRLNQDVLENFFAIVRQRGGSNRNPSVRIFRAIFRTNAIHQIMKPPSTNCEQDQDVYMDLNEETNDFTTEATTSTALTEVEVVSPEHFSNSESSSETENMPPLEECALVYFAGYLVKSLLQKFKCKMCEKHFAKDNIFTEDNELLIKYRQYTRSQNVPGGLQAPSDLAKHVCFIALNTMTNVFRIIRWRKPLKKLIYKKVLHKVVKTDPTWLQVNSSCIEHRHFFLNNLITIKLHKECKWISRDLRNHYPRKNKLKIFQHQ